MALNQTVDLGRLGEVYLRVASDSSVSADRQ